MLAYLAATLYPYEFRENHARITATGTVFSEPGIVLWDSPAARAPRESLRVRLSLIPLESHQFGPARILTFSKNRYQANFTIGQEGDDLVLRARRELSSPFGTPSLVVEDVFRAGQRCDLDIAISRTAISVRIDGQREQVWTTDLQDFRRWSADHAIALGNEHSTLRPWVGTIFEAQMDIDGDSYDLLEPAQARKPTFWDFFFHRSIIVALDPADLLVNFLAMVVIGAAAASLLPGRSAVELAGFWLVLALIVELLQVSIPGRVPSLSDVVLNGAGVYAGARLMESLIAGSRQLRGRI